jgi:ribosomal protein L19E
VIQLPKIGGQVERQPRPRRDHDAVRSARAIKRRDGRGLAEANARYDRQVQAVAHGEVDRRGARHATQRCKGAGCRSGDESARVRRAQDCTQLQHRLRRRCRNEDALGGTA